MSPRRRRVLVAAYLVDRADQYETDSPCWIALTDAAHNIINGEVEAALANGDLDAALIERVSAWIGDHDARPVDPSLGVDGDEP